MLAGFLLEESPLELLVDGDLLLLVQQLIDAWGPGATAVSKVNGHSDEGLVRGGSVRELDKIGNDMADQAADLGRRKVGADITDARRNVLMPVSNGIPVIRDLHRFFYCYC